MITARGIYNNLKESTYSFTYLDIVFYFSSQQYKNKFKNNVDEFVKNQENKIKSFYKLEINFKKFLAISYYKKIEKRGFRIILIEADGRRFEKQSVFITNEIS